MQLDYGEYFERATGHPPHDYQRRIGEADRLPDVIDVPTGLGKTAAIVLAWLWHWLGGSPQAARRLVIALPMRTLVEQTATSVRRWLERLEIAGEVDVLVLMGGTPRSVAQDWRANPERPSILVGTVDVVVSKLLMRGYGTARNAYPMDAALTWNDAHLVVDETQLAAASTRTLRQVSAFQRSSHVAPFGVVGLTCMSATIDPRLLNTVDNPVADATFVRLTEADDDDDIRRRRGAVRTIRAAGFDAGKPRNIAGHAIQHHRPGTLTLIIVNSVAAAREVHAALRKAKPSADLVLLHSRFRPADRKPLVDRAVGPVPDEGRIVVSTQVVEAGVDVDAALLVTEVSPWPSFIQRVGRCNRAGKRTDSEVHWVDAGTKTPYDPSQIAATREALVGLEGCAVTSTDLLGVDVATGDRLPTTLRRTDFLTLFDTAPDLTGNDLDIAPYIRESDDLDVSLAWADWREDRPPSDLRLPAHEARCAVSIATVREYQKAGAVLWRGDPRSGSWTPAGLIRPGEMLLAHVITGGYDPTTGFDGKSTGPVPSVDVPPAPAGDPESETANSTDGLVDGCDSWVPLDQHLRETEEEALAIVETLALPSELAADVVLAARLHDVGKAHPTWQDALVATASEEDHASVADGRPWAKSAIPRDTPDPANSRQQKTRRRLRVVDADGKQVAFRHELAGVLALQTVLAGLMTGAHDPDLVRYLVLAHHGKLRVTVRELGTHADDRLLGIPDGDSPSLPDVLGTSPATGRESSIRQFRLDGDPDRGLPAWADTTQALLDRYGPFRLAYLETLVRAADWRASARHDAGR